MGTIMDVRDRKASLEVYWERLTAAELTRSRLALRHRNAGSVSSFSALSCGSSGGDYAAATASMQQDQGHQRQRRCLEGVGRWVI